MSGLEGLLAGRVLVNRYRVEEVIGRGGFAAVYRADDLRLGRSVAVKVITLSAGDAALRDGLRERFQREARAAAGLPHHPNLVAVHDFGTDAELDLDFLVMELLRGEDLATYLAAQPRPPLELAVAVLVDAGEGLAVGHRAGLVHRDVKPGNLFLAEPHGGEPFRVCVLDYGIARLQQEEQTQTRLTQEGSAPLSPAYASPEQLRGEMDLTPASDVFSLGVVGYQLLTGERPFGAERRSRREGEAEAVRPLRELAPQVPPAVEAVIARALSERPEDRFTHAGEMAAALSAAVRAPVVDGDGDDDGEATVLTPVVVAAPASAPLPRDDDATLIQAPASTSAPPVASAPPTPAPPPVRPAPVREAAPPPAPRRRGMGGVLIALLLLAGAAVAAWMLLGGGDGGAEPVDEAVVEVEDSLPVAEGPGVTIVPAPETTQPEPAIDVAPAPGAGEGSPPPAEGAPRTTAPATGGTAAPAPQQPAPVTPSAPTPGVPPATQPQPQPAPQPQPEPTRPQPEPTRPQPQPTPQPPRPAPQPTPQPQPPAPPEPRPEPLPPTPLPRPVIPSPFPAPRDTIRIRPLPGRPVPDVPASTAPAR